MVSPFDSYCASFPASTQTVLAQVFSVIRTAAPQATEKIAYGIPTFVFHGNLVHVGAYAHHIGFYPGSEAIQVFSSHLTPYKHSKGTIQFPLDAPIPFALIKEITEYRVKQNMKKKV